MIAMNDDDFAGMIAGLEATGYSRTQIARECNISRTTIWRLAEGVGREPLYSTGRRIERLFERAVSPVKHQTA